MIILNFIIVQIVLFVIIIFFMKKMVFTDTSSALIRLDRARERVKKQEQELEKKKKECEEECDAKRAKAAKEAEDILKEARERAEKESNDTLSRSKTKGEEIVQKAIDAKDKIRKDILKDIDIKTIDFSSRALDKVLQKKMGEKFNEYLAEDFIEEFKSTDAKYIGKDVKSVEVISRYKLPAETLKRISKTINEKLKRDLKVLEKTDNKVLNGIVLKFGTLVIDGSLAANIKDAMEQIKKEIES